jgi:transposase InsO family protein
MSSSPRTRATRWVFLAVKHAKTPAAARSFLQALAKATPVKSRTILTDHGKEFTDQVFGQELKDATGAHEFDALCPALGIEHGLTKPKSPRTSGMVERFNGRLAQILRTHPFPKPVRNHPGYVSYGPERISCEGFSSALPTAVANRGWTNSSC